MKHFSAQVLPVKLPPYFQPHFLWILMCIKCCSTLTCFISSVEMLFSCLSLLSKAQDFLQRPWFIIHPWLHTSHIVCLRSALINVSAAFLLSARLCSFCECPCFVLYILYYIFSIFAFNFWFNFSCDMFSGFSQLHTVPLALPRRIPSRVRCTRWPFVW